MDLLGLRRLEVGRDLLQTCLADFWLLKTNVLTGSPRRDPVHLLAFSTSRLKTRLAFSLTRKGHRKIRLEILILTPIYISQTKSPDISLVSRTEWSVRAWVLHCSAVRAWPISSSSFIT